MSDRALPPEPDALHLTLEELEQIAGGDPEATDPRRIDHLEQCEECRERLTRTAAEPSFWDQSSDLLRSAVFDARDSGVAEPADDSPGTDEATALVVRSLLAPSEQENSLGRLGRFEVLGIVGSGGMGMVLKCRDVDIDRVVAIKIPSPQLWRCGAALETLEREARSAASVVHPNVIAIYQVDRWRDVPYLVMARERGAVTGAPAALSMTPGPARRCRSTRASNSRFPPVATARRWCASVLGRTRKRAGRWADRDELIEFPPHHRPGRLAAVRSAVG